MGDRGEACRDSAVAQASGNLSANGLELTREGEEGEERRLVDSSGRLLPAASRAAHVVPSATSLPVSTHSQVFPFLSGDYASRALQHRM